MFEGARLTTMERYNYLIKNIRIENRDYWFLCKPIFMKFMFAKFKEEIIDFLKSDDIEDVDDEEYYKALSFISKYNRLDLCEIVYLETEAFNEINLSVDLATEFGNLEVVEYLTRMGAFCSTRAMDWAAMKGHLDVVKWLHFNRAEGCTEDAINWAAMNGHLDVIKWLHLNRSEVFDESDRLGSNEWSS